MPPLRRHVIVVVLAVLATGGGLKWVDHRRAVELDRLRYDNARLRTELHQRTVKAVANEEGEAPAATKATGGPSPIAAEPEPPVARYFDEGQATPLAALQTLAWAGDRGDAERLRGLIRLDPEARRLAEAYWASLSPAVQSSFGDSLDTMAATLLTGAIMRAPYPEASVLAAAEWEPVDGQPDRRRLRLPDTPKDGQLFEQVDGEWAYVITPELVRAYLAENRPGG